MFHTRHVKFLSERVVTFLRIRPLLQHVEFFVTRLATYGCDYDYAAPLVNDNERILEKCFLWASFNVNLCLKD